MFTTKFWYQTAKVSLSSLIVLMLYVVVADKVGDLFSFLFSFWVGLPIGDISFLHRVVFALIYTAVILGAQSLLMAYHTKLVMEGTPQSQWKSNLLMPVMPLFVALLTGMLAILVSLSIAAAFRGTRDNRSNLFPNDTTQEFGNTQDNASREFRVQRATALREQIKRLEELRPLLSDTPEALRQNDDTIEELRKQLRTLEE
jgi:hypothetical protein